MIAAHVEAIRVFIRDTDWAQHDERVRWQISRPSCDFHDGSIICPVWKDWLSGGIKYYETDKALFEAIRSLIPGNIPEAEVLKVIASCRAGEEAGKESISALQPPKRTT